MAEAKENVWAFASNSKFELNPTMVDTTHCASMKRMLMRIWKLMSSSIASKTVFLVFIEADADHRSESVFFVPS